MKPEDMTDLQRLAYASVMLVQKDKRIKELEGQLAFATARLRIVDMKISRLHDDIPALLRPQAG